MMADRDALKAEYLEARADYREQLFREPRLQNLFLELTTRCNLRCEHCGSSCGDVPPADLPAPVIHDLLVKVRRDFDISGLLLCITGGEPMLRKDFFDIMADAAALGYRWGMTSNATLIDAAAARRLRETGLRTISVSIDGLEATHDAMRGAPGAWQRAMAGIQALLDCGGFRHVIGRSNLGIGDVGIDIGNIAVNGMDVGISLGMKAIATLCCRVFVVRCPDDGRDARIWCHIDIYGTLFVIKCRVFLFHITFLLLIIYNNVRAHERIVTSTTSYYHVRAQWRSVTLCM